MQKQETELIVKQANQIAAEDKELLGEIALRLGPQPKRQELPLDDFPIIDVNDVKDESIDRINASALGSTRAKSAKSAKS